MPSSQQRLVLWKAGHIADFEDIEMLKSVRFCDMNFWIVALNVKNSVFLNFP